MRKCPYFSEIYIEVGRGKMTQYLGIALKYVSRYFLKRKVLVEANTAIKCWLWVIDIWVFIVLVSTFTYA